MSVTTTGSDISDERNYRQCELGKQKDRILYAAEELMRIKKFQFTAVIEKLGKINLTMRSGVF